MNKFKGIMPALITPINGSGEINIPVLEQLTDFLLENGADGFYIGGATGEGILLGKEAREMLAERSVAHIAHRVPAIVHIASVNHTEAKELARHAEKCGADAISAIPPMFYGYDADDVFNYYKDIAESVSIPLMVYYNPNAGFHMTADFAARLFEIDNVTSIKWTSSDYFGMIRLKELTHGEMNIINGPDQMLLMGLAAGADGGIGTTYNFMLGKIKRIYDSFVSGDIEGARQAQNEVDAVISVLSGYSTVPATKAVLEKMGFAVGDCAMPLKKYTDSEKTKIFNEMKEAGL